MAAYTWQISTEGGNKQQYRLANKAARMTTRRPSLHNLSERVRNYYTSFQHHYSIISTLDSIPLVCSWWWEWCHWPWGRWTQWPPAGSSVSPRASTEPLDGGRQQTTTQVTPAHNTIQHIPSTLIMIMPRYKFENWAYHLKELLLSFHKIIEIGPSELYLRSRL